jgi:hypothetical protein
MSTKAAAIYRLLNDFGIPAYASSAVPEDAEFPYITYDLVVGAWDTGEISLPFNVWYRTDSEAEPNAKVQEISERIGIGGVFLLCDGGAMWIKRGEPWCQSMTDTDDKIKRRYLNLTIEFATTD